MEPDEPLPCNGHLREYEDGVGWVCRVCGEELPDDDED